jgi:hypothetical protein
MGRLHRQMNEKQDRNYATQRLSLTLLQLGENVGKNGNPTGFDRDGTLLMRRAPPDPERSASFLHFTSCSCHVLKQRFLPASLDDGVAKGFRKAI